MLLIIGDFFSSGPFQGAFWLLAGGPLTAPFWVLLVGIGLLLPLLLEMGEAGGRIRDSLAAPLLVLYGGFAFRVIIFFGGQMSAWGTLR